MAFSSQDIDEVDVLTLEYEPRNALDIDAVTELRKYFEGCCRPLVITGAGGAFSAGVNIGAFESYSNKKRARFFRKITRMVAACSSIETPVVAAVNGHALGGGLVLGLCADYRLVADGDHKFGLTEAQAGVPFPDGPLELIRRELPPGLLRNLTLSGRVARTGELLDAGVFDECVPADRLLDRAVAKAREMADQPAFAAVKQQVRGGLAARLQALAG